jgi:hypothetical protein
MAGGLHVWSGLVLAGLVAVGLSGPARAQFIAPGSYPVIVVPPPQTMTTPNPPRTRSPPPDASAHPPQPEPPDLSRNYQGRTRITR